MDSTIISITDLRQNAASVLKRVKKTGEPITILQRSQPKAVIVDHDYFKALEEAYMDLTDAREAERAKKEPKHTISLAKYIEERWGKIDESNN
jgi:prevent-host-death family protein